MFTTTLTPQDRRLLMFVLVAAPLLDRQRTGRDMPDDDHASVLSRWLEKNDRKVSLITRARFLSYSSRFYKQLIRTQAPEHIAILCAALRQAFEGGERPPLAEQLMADCTQLLVEHKLDQ